METFKEFLKESNYIEDNTLNKSLNKLLRDMKSLLPEIDKAGENEDWDADTKLNKKYNALSRKAKKEFKRSRIENLYGVDYHGYMDTFYSK